MRETTKDFELNPLLLTLIRELTSHHIPTRMGSLRWINMLLEKQAAEMNVYISELLPALLKTLSDDSDDVVLMNLKVSRGHLFCLKRQRLHCWLLVRVCVLMLIPGSS